MEVISIIALLLLSLLGYSVGAVALAGKSRDLKPMIIDLVLIGLIWAGAIYSRLTWQFDKWLLILISMVVAGCVGMISMIPRKSSLRIVKAQPAQIPQTMKRRPLMAWRAFSLRLGTFQSRVWLSLFFFILISPAAVLVKLFSDPLRIKRYEKTSHWIPKEAVESELDQYRRQF